MESDGYAALITVDANGQPRVRSVGVVWNDAEAGDPRKALNLWVMTRDSTRKVEQIRNHSQVTLYFNDDAKFSYLSIMGKAILHTDPASAEVQPVLLQKWRDYFWPEFPRGFVMIEIQPQWVEFMGPGIPNNKVTWRPQAVELQSE